MGESRSVFLGPSSVLWNRTNFVPARWKATHAESAAEAGDFRAWRRTQWQESLRTENRVRIRERDLSRYCQAERSGNGTANRTSPKEPPCFLADTRSPAGPRLGYFRYSRPDAVGSNRLLDGLPGQCNEQDARQRIGNPGVYRATLLCAWESKVSSHPGFE